MATYSVTHRWVCGTYGWDEHWYLTASDLVQARIRSDSIAQARLNMCGSEPLIEIWRKSVFNVADPAERLNDNFPVANPKSPWFGNEVDRPWTGALLRLTSDVGSKRNFVARGIPDIVTDRVWNKFVNDPKYVQAVRAFKNTLLTSQALIRRLNIQASPRRDISAMATVLPHGWVTVTTASHGLVTGDHIRWHRVKATPNCFKGTVKVTRLTADTFQVRNTNIRVLNFVFGQYVQVLYAYDLIAEVESIRVAEHPTGGAKNTTKGRASPCRK